MISPNLYNSIVIWAITLAPPAIVLLMWTRITLTQRLSNNRKPSSFAALSLTLASSVLFVVAVMTLYLNLWQLDEVITEALLILPAGATVLGIILSGAVTIISAGILGIAGLFAFDALGESAANNVVRPICLSDWDGSPKEKATRAIFLVILLWFIVGAFINPLNIVMGNMLLTTTWMESFAWLVGLPGLLLWWYGLIYEPGRSALHQ